ncbi:MAG: binding sensor regulator [Acidimicrobiales bacterium]|nr:binding sensor regulator [Acidimicrobiales bacterium]
MLGRWVLGPDVELNDLPDDVSDVEERLRRVERVLETQRTLPSKLEAIADVAQRTIHNCDGAAVSLLVEGGASSLGVSSRMAMEVDLVQYQTAEGPCLRAISSGQRIRIDVLGEDDRFTHFAPGAIELGVESVLSVPLDIDGRTVGALNLYSHLPKAFDDRTEVAVAPLAEYAATLIASSPLYAYTLDAVEGLNESLEAREQIATAVGILRDRGGLSEEEAFGILRSRALSRGLSVREVARELLAGLPPGD